MIYTLNPTAAQKIQVRLLGIVGFAVLTAIGAQVSIPLEPVPITGQVFMVLLAGFILGPRDGFISQMTYLGMIAMNLPVAANGMGSAALMGPTVGYLYSFPAAAWVAGMLAIRDRVWVRWLAGLAAVAVIYLVGASYLKAYLNLSWRAAWLAGVEPFIALDVLKALLAASMAEGGRAAWLRFGQH